MNNSTDSIIDSATDALVPENPLGRLLYAVSYLFAVTGGLVVSALAVMVVISVIGRWLFSYPIPGDFELVALGTAVSIFLFLPYCHMRRGNIIVDLFLSWAPKQVQALFDAIGSLGLALIAAMLAWRMGIGGVDAVRSGETTYTLALPIWWAYPFAVSSLALLTAVGLYAAVQELARSLRGRGR